MTFKGMALKRSIQEAQKEAKKWSQSHIISSVFQVFSKILEFLSLHTTYIKARQAIFQRVLPLVE